MQKTIYDIFKNNLKRLVKNINSKKFLIAYSGGLDSTVLLDLFLKLKESYEIGVFVCYVNHNLRGHESLKEEEFVKDYVQRLNIEGFFIKSVPQSYWQNIKSKSIEMLAREVRYSFFKEIAETKSIDYIVTAHHFNDKIETFFLNLLRGTDLQGLRSIPIKNKNIIRPLLNISKKEIEDYVNINNLKYIIDSSNLKDIYKRNIVRNKLLPVLNKITPYYKKSFKYFFKFVNEQERFLYKYIKNILKNITIFKSNSIFVIDYNIFKKKDTFIKKRIIKYILKSIGCKDKQNKNIFKIMNNKRILYEKYNLFFGSKFKFLYFINKDGLKKIENQLIFRKQENFIVTNFRFEIFENNSADYKKEIVFNRDKAKFPIIIRNINDDDTIIINSKNKNIKKLLKKDIGIPDILIPYTIVLENSDKEIIAFLINNIFRVNEKYFVNESSHRLVFKITPLFWQLLSWANNYYHRAWF